MHLKLNDKIVSDPIKTCSSKRPGIPPNTVTLVCCLKACGSIRATLVDNEIPKQIVQKVVTVRDYFMGNTLVDMYAKCGSLAEVHVVFDSLSIQESVTWNALIA